MPALGICAALVCQEAAASGNLLVLNDDVPAMRDVYGAGAHYVHFGSARSPSPNCFPDGTDRVLRGLIAECRSPGAHQK